MADRISNRKRLQHLAASRKSYKKYKKEYGAKKRAYRQKHWRLTLWRIAKKRAAAKGLDFNIELSDIENPAYCPVLGIALQHGLGRPYGASPSLDRIDNAKGYVKGNVIVVSMRANRIKCDATIDELKRVADFYVKFILENKS